MKAISPSISPFKIILLPALGALLVFQSASAQRAKPPVRAFDAPGAPEFIRLDDKPGVNPPVDAGGNYLIGPNYKAAPERQANEDVPKGKVRQFAIDSKTTKLMNPGIARKEFGKVDPKNPKTLIVETHEIDYTRKITVYVPAQYEAGSVAPFMVCHDGPKGKPKQTLHNILDNLIAQKRIPPIIVIQIANGGGDAQGHQRGKEYDTMSGLFAEYIETEVLPRVEKNCDVKLTEDPDGRAAMGNSSGGSAALIMAAFSLTALCFTPASGQVTANDDGSPGSPFDSTDEDSAIAAGPSVTANDNGVFSLLSTDTTSAAGATVMSEGTESTSPGRFSYDPFFSPGAQALASAILSATPSTTRFGKPPPSFPRSASPARATPPPEPTPPGGQT